MDATTTQMIASVVPGMPVRYIKLGEAGLWERECIDQGTIRFGFDSANAEKFPLCLDGRWDELMESFIADGRSKGTATNFTNQTRLFFEDDGSTLWITFVGENLWWGVLEPARPQRHSDIDGVWRTVRGGWQKTDGNGEPLTKDRLSGALTMITAYRGTSCSVDTAAYVIQRIRGEKSDEVNRAIAASKEMKSAVLGLMRKLVPQDFELLVDLVFSSSGWRRQSVVGKTQKTIDIDLMLPSTGERAFVQVKSQTTSAGLAEYVGKLDDLGPYDRMFYVYHTGEAETDDDRVIIIGPEKLAEMVLDAGLANWLIRKVS